MFGLKKRKSRKELQRQLKALESDYKDLWEIHQKVLKAVLELQEENKELKEVKG